MKNILTLGNLFDGSGGFSLGGLLSGITPVWASEIEPFPIRVTTKRFPDNWCSDLSTPKPTDEEMYFWHKVFKTYSEVTGCKMKSDKQIAKWLKNPYSDSAEYRMWGNGVALPCVWFVLSGIVWYTQNDAENPNT